MILEHLCISVIDQHNPLCLANKMLWWMLKNPWEKYTCFELKVLSLKKVSRCVKNGSQQVKDWEDVVGSCESESFCNVILLTWPRIVVEKNWVPSIHQFSFLFFWTEYEFLRIGCNRLSWLWCADWLSENCNGQYQYQTSRQLAWSSVDAILV